MIQQPPAAINIDFIGQNESNPLEDIVPPPQKAPSISDQFAIRTPELAENEEDNNTARGVEKEQDKDIGVNA